MEHYRRWRGNIFRPVPLISSSFVASSTIPPDGQHLSISIVFPIWVCTSVSNEPLSGAGAADPASIDINVCGFLFFYFFSSSSFWRLSTLTVNCLLSFLFLFFKTKSQLQLKLYIEFDGEAPAKRVFVTCLQSSFSGHPTRKTNCRLL
jgi:hypothetical protein